jgi:hypothetical protein
MKLLQYLMEISKKWSIIAKLIKGRTDVQFKYRFRKLANANINFIPKSNKLYSMMYYDEILNQSSSPTYNHNYQNNQRLNKDVFKETENPNEKQENDEESFVFQNQIDFFRFDI